MTAESLEKLGEWGLVDGGVPRHHPWQFALILAGAIVTVAGAASLLLLVLPPVASSIADVVIFWTRLFTGK